MRRTFLISSICAAAIYVNTFAGDVKVFAGARFDAKTWGGLQSYDVRTLSKNLDARVGQLIELHFQFRSKDVRHLKPNWYQGSVWQSGKQNIAPESRSRGNGNKPGDVQQGWIKGIAGVPVMIAAGDVAAFKAFTTDSRATADLKVYGQVLYDFEANFVFVRLIGTQTFVDEDNNINVTW